MINKTCGECRFLLPEYDRQGRGKCYFTDNRYLPSCGACKAFVERYSGSHPTNGDKIRQMITSELIDVIKCPYPGKYCVHRCMHGYACDCCKRDWLNAPAKSEGKDE